MFAMMIIDVINFEVNEETTYLKIGFCSTIYLSYD